MELAAIGGVLLLVRWRSRRKQLLRTTGGGQPDAATVADGVRRACARIAAMPVRQTPVLHADSLTARIGCSALLKLECLQLGGSFKVRGAMNKLLKVAANRSGPCCVYTASSGNHGIAVATAAQHLGGRGIRVTVLLPHGASQVKVEKIRGLGAEVQFHGSDVSQAETRARLMAQERHGEYVSPYNDLDVVCGQGTIAAELMCQLTPAQVGGGGLISGIAAHIKHACPHVRVIGCQPTANACMAKSVLQRRILSEAEAHCADTLSDGTAGGIEDAAITFPLCQALVDEWVLVSEADIAKCMRDVLAQEHVLIEGAAACAVAAMLQHAGRYAPDDVAVGIMCGGNVSSATMAAQLSHSSRQE